MLPVKFANWELGSAAKSRDDSYGQQYLESTTKLSLTSQNIAELWSIRGALLHRSGRISNE
jgi:hypothetical protein